MWPFKKKEKKKTCDECEYHQIIETKHYGFFVSVCVCGQSGTPISVSKYRFRVNYTRPDWCPKKREKQIK